ncbi:hypothetical protein KC957_03175, partial [Candidatus Saccharibacteria bacterium]|nr:hypothetical protein [Candidatus Saccharibacteria bacterium]
MVRQQNRTIAVVLALLLVVTQIVPAVAQSDSPTVQAERSIRVGAAPSTEARLLSQMLAMLLEEAGYVVDVQTEFDDAMELRTALEDNRLDLYPEYTGTALTDYNDLPVDALP